MAENDENKTDSAEKNTIKNVVFSFKNVFIAEHLFGICRFSVQGEQLVPTTWKTKTYCFVSICIYMMVYFYLLPWPRYMDKTTAFVEILGVVPTIISITYFLILAIYTTFFYNKGHNDIFFALAALDTQLMIASNEFYKKSATKTNKWLAFVIICFVVIFSVGTLSIDKAFDYREIFFMPIYLIQHLEVMLFCLIVSILRNRLDIINGYITKFLEEKNYVISVFTLKEKGRIKTINMIGRPADNNMKIRDLALMYDSIGSICFTVNKIFNFQIFMTLLSTFCYILITIWTTLYYYKTPSHQSEALVSVVIWCVTTLLIVGTVCLFCERLLSMRSSTRVLVNELIMDYSLPKTMRVQAKAFMELIEAWPLRILIYDMFSVDISLMLKFISVSTTYLIVIIQVSHFD